MKEHARRLFCRSLQQTGWVHLAHCTTAVVMKQKRDGGGGMGLRGQERLLATCLACMHPDDVQAFLRHHVSTTGCVCLRRVNALLQLPSLSTPQRFQHTFDSPPLSPPPLPVLLSFLQVAYAGVTSTATTRVGFGECSCFRHGKVTSSATTPLATSADTAHANPFSIHPLFWPYTADGFVGDDTRTAQRCNGGLKYASARASTRTFVSRRCG